MLNIDRMRLEGGRGQAKRSASNQLRLLRKLWSVSGGITEEANGCRGSVRCSESGVVGTVHAAHSEKPVVAKKFRGVRFTVPPSP